MKEGTKSLLFGCHDILHSIFVIKAWMHIYKRPPKLWEVICIFLHDIGHIGKDYLTYDEEKKEHWILGARIANVLFGLKGFLFIAGHSNRSGYPRSKLYKADKYSWLVAWRWWLIKNERIEDFHRAKGKAGIDNWLRKVRENAEKDFPKGIHEIYLEMKEKENEKTYEEKN